MPVYDMDLVMLSEEGDSLTTRMHSLPEDTGEENPAYLTRPVLLEGRMPEKAGECVVVLTKSLGTEKEWVGATLTVDPDGELEDQMEQEFTVVGTVRSSAFVSMEQEHTTAGSGTLELMAYTVPESFTMDYYTGFYFSVEGAAALNASSQEYEDTVGAVSAALEDLGVDRSQLRYEELVDDAEAELDEYRKLLEAEGMTIYQPTDEEMAGFQEAASTCWSQAEEIMGSERYDALMAALGK